jgi:TP901 family phage tail tape measure protein
MSNIYNYIFNVLLKDNNVIAQFNKIDQQINMVDQSVNKLGVNIKNQLSKVSVAALAENIERTGRAFKSLSAGGVEFDKSMKELSAITGITGDELKKLEDSARKVGMSSGLGAAGAADAYKVLASNIEVSTIGMDGLNELQQKSITLAQASGLSIEESATALAATVNQFGLEATEANRIINVLAAGSKIGAAEIPDLAESFKVVGSAANAAGLSVEQTAGAIEVLSQNNVKGAEAGTKLRNIILKLQTKGGVDFSKTSLGDALDSLKPKLQDATYLSKLFGMENVAAAQFMIENAASVGEFTDKVTGTNTATEQASIMQETMESKMGKIQAKIDNMKVGLFNLTGGTISYIGVAGEMAGEIANLIPILNGLWTMIRFITNAEKMKALWTGIAATATAVWSKIQLVFNAIMLANPIGLIIAAIVVLIAIIAYVCYKTEGWGTLWEGVVGFMKNIFYAFIEGVKLYFNTLINGILIGIDKIKLGWYKFKEAVGIGDSTENQAAISAINANVERRQKEIVDGAKKVADYANKAKESLGKIDMKWNSEKSLSDITGSVKEKMGINEQLQSAAGGAGGGKSTGIGGEIGKGTNEAIATGGTRNTTVNIRVGEMIGTMSFNGGFSENESEIKSKLKILMAEIFGMAETQI